MIEVMVALGVSTGTALGCSYYKFVELLDRYLEESENQK